MTFEESRYHLGVASQRQWARRAIERTTPCLLGLFSQFSLATLMGQALDGSSLPTRQSAWYAKGEATCADALAAVRRHLWANPLVNTPPPLHTPELVNSPERLFASLVEAACYAA